MNLSYELDKQAIGDDQNMVYADYKFNRKKGDDIEFKFCEFCGEKFDIDSMIKLDEALDFDYEKYACWECFGIEEQGYPEMNENGCDYEDEEEEYPGEIY